MAISAAQVKELREKTGLGIMDCKAALAETGGDVDKAIDLLRKKGMADAAKRSGRATQEGRVGAYIHPPGLVGVLLELNCETDFVAKGGDFTTLLQDLCMQVAASRPEYVSREEVPEDVVAHEREIYLAQVQDKPEPVQEKIVQGKLENFYKTVCLLDQPFVREPKKSVQAVIQEAIAKLGENITVRRFSRFAVGEEG